MERIDGEHDSEVRFASCCGGDIPLQFIQVARVVAEAGPSDEGALEARMPTIQPPDEVEAVTLLSASEPVHEPPDGPAPGQPV